MVHVWRVEVEDGAKGGWYLVGGREIRADHEPLAERLACTPIEPRTEKDRERVRGEG